MTHNAPNRCKPIGEGSGRGGGGGGVRLDVNQDRRYCENAGGPVGGYEPRNEVIVK